MKLIDMTCPKCGAQMLVGMDKEMLFCSHCGGKLMIDNEVQHVAYDNAGDAGYQFERGRIQAQQEAMRAMDERDRNISAVVWLIMLIAMLIFIILLPFIE